MLNPNITTDTAVCECQTDTSGCLNSLRYYPDKMPVAPASTEFVLWHLFCLAIEGWAYIFFDSALKKENMSVTQKLLVRKMQWEKAVKLLQKSMQSRKKCHSSGSYCLCRDSPMTLLEQSLVSCVCIMASGVREFTVTIIKIGFTITCNESLVVWLVKTTKIWHQ